jgi:hypothetical protein
VTWEETAVFTVNDRPVFRLGMTKDQAKYIDKVQVKEFTEGGDNPRIIEVWDHLVELPGRDGGAPVRLTIRTRGPGFQLPELGSMVSVVVNRRRTKAHFDADDPKISLGARYELGKEQRKAKAAKDKARFEAKRDGRA